MITHWTYRWTKVTPGRGAVAKIVNCKGAKVKVTAKKKAGLTKYQVRYKVAGAKNWTTTKTAKTPSFVIKVKKARRLQFKSEDTTRTEPETGALQNPFR